MTIRQETELPLRVHVIYNSWELNYQQGHEYAPRLITDSKQIETIEISNAITAVEARRIADIWLAIRWLERIPIRAKLSRKYLLLDAADTVTVTINET
jgi:hypothetical protein